MDKNGIKENSIIYRFFTSAKAEAFIFSLLCATLFTCGLCHWLLDITYKYYPAQEGKPFYVDFTWVFPVMVVIAGFYLVRDYALQKKAVKFDFALVILFQLMFFTGVLAYHNESYPAVPYAWILPMAYIVGKLAIGTDRNTIPKRAITLYFVLAVSLYLVDILDFCENIKYKQEYGHLLTEFWFCFWTGELQNRCTMEFGLLLITCSLGYMFIQRKSHKILFALVVIANIFTIIFDILVTGKENLLLMPISLLLVCIMLTVDSWTGLSQTIRSSIIISVVAIIMIGIILIAIFYFNIFGIREELPVEEFVHQILLNARLSLDWNGFKGMLKYPLENYGIMDGYDESHSMLLEYGRVYGLTVFIGLVVFRLLIIKDIIKMMISKTDRLKAKYLLVPACVSVNIYYTLEPNGFDLRYIWMPGLFISGMIRGWNDIEGKRQN